MMTLQRVDGGWIVGVDGTLFHIRTWKRGFQYVAALIENCGREIHVVRLFHEGATEADSTGTRSAQPLADKQAIRAILARYTEVKDALAEGVFDELERDALETEAEKLGEYLRSVGAAFKHGRRFNDESERARTNIRHRIASAIQDIEAACPELAAHLRECLKTGFLCSYDPPPDKKVRWHVNRHDSAQIVTPNRKQQWKMIMTVDELAKALNLSNERTKYLLKQAGVEVVNGSQVLKLADADALQVHLHHALIDLIFGAAMEKGLATNPRFREKFLDYLSAVTDVDIEMAKAGRTGALRKSAGGSGAAVKLAQADPFDYYTGQRRDN